MKTIFLFSICILLQSYVYCARNSFLRASDNAEISLDEKCLIIKSTLSNILENDYDQFEYKLCCAKNWSKIVILPYFDVRSGFDGLKNDFETFIDGRNCEWEKKIL